MKTQNEGIRILEEFVCQAIPDQSVVAHMALKAEIEWPGVNPQDLVDELTRALPAEHRELVTLSVELAKRKPGVLALDAGIIGAMIQGGATVVAGFITALLSRALLAQPPKAKGASVIITVAGGVTHELPVEATPDQINQIVSALKNAQQVRLKVKARK